MTARTPDLPNIPLIESGAEACATLSETYPELAETITSLQDRGFAIVDPEFAADDLDAVDAYSRKALAGTDRIQDG